jgi:hypothetical protein
LLQINDPLPFNIFNVQPSRSTSVFFLFLLSMPKMHSSLLWCLSALVQLLVFAHAFPTLSLTEADSKPPAFFLAGDSTTAKQSSGGGGWGTGFLSFLERPAIGTNYGHNGATTVSFKSGGDWDKVIGDVKRNAGSHQVFVTIQVRLRNTWRSAKSARIGADRMRSLDIMTKRKIRIFWIGSFKAISKLWLRMSKMLAVQRYASSDESRDSANLCRL